MTDDDAAAQRDRERLLRKAGPARERYQARQRRLAAHAQAQAERDAALLTQATGGDAVEAAIARALARRQRPA